MKIGLQINDFTWPGGPKTIGPTLAKIARAADAGGFDPIGVMDHFFQIRVVTPDGRIVQGEKTCMFHMDIGERGENVGPTIERLKGLSKMGFTTVMGGVKGVSKITPLEIIAREVIPAVAAF